MGTSKGIDAVAWFYGQSFNGRVEDCSTERPKLPCTRPNCQDPSCDRDHGEEDEQ